MHIRPANELSGAQNEVKEPNEVSETLTKKAVNEETTKEMSDLPNEM